MADAILYCAKVVHIVPRLLCFQIYYVTHAYTTNLGGGSVQYPKTQTEIDNPSIMSTLCFAMSPAITHVQVLTEPGRLYIQ